MTEEPAVSTPSDNEIERLARSVHLLIRVFLVSGRAGAPAEGKIPFNPLYFHFLGVLWDEGPTRPSALADILGVPRTTLSTASRALQNRGLITAAKDATDGRAQLLALTKDGEDVIASIRRQDRRNMAAILRLLDDNRRTVLIEALEEVTRSIAP